MRRMFRLNDLILLLVVFLSMVAGILFPDYGSPFQPFPQLFLMILFFLSFLPIQFGEIGLLLRRSPGTIAFFTVFKVIILPLGIYFLFRAIAPAYAPSAFLLSAISTGVSAPFISNLVGGNSAFVMVMVVVTSLLIPLTIPILVKMILGHYVEISFSGMLQMLSVVIFVPILAVKVLRRFLPGLIPGLMKVNYPLSLILFALINLGVFSKYTGFFHQGPSTIVAAALVATFLGAVYVLLGILLFLKRPVEDRIAGAISIGNMNNVLVVVFASHFFGALESSVAALYIFPYFLLILPLRFYENRVRKLCASKSEPFRDKPRHARSNE